MCPFDGGNIERGYAAYFKILANNQGQLSESFGDIPKHE